MFVCLSVQGGGWVGGGVVRDGGPRLGAVTPRVAVTQPAGPPRQPLGADTGNGFTAWERYGLGN